VTVYRVATVKGQRYTVNGRRVTVDD
jgi:hypothetical protein